MAFTACMAVISAAALVLTMRWQDLEGGESGFLPWLLLGTASLSTCAFGLLGMAHLLCLLLRKSVWRRDPHPGPGERIRP